MDEYINYLKDNPKGYWFKRKLYGWGWTPVRWQGILTTLIYSLGIVAFALTIDKNSSVSEIVFTCILPITLLTITFIRILYKKGEPPRWTWGIPKKESQDIDSPSL